MSYSAAGTHVKRPGDDIEALTTCNYLRLFGPNSYNRPAPTPFSYPPQSFTSSALSTSSPSDPTLTYLSSADFEAYLISHLEALVNEDQSQTALHLRWIGNVQSMIHRRLIQGATPQEAEVLHGDWLEISLLRTALTQSSNAYTILRNATPTFLQHAYSLPNLWSVGSDGTSIPLTNVISSKHSVLSSFSLIDCICAMVFGLPQQIEYDTSIGILPAGLSPYEWVHGTPTEFHILLAEINACRDKSPRVRDWREIEHTLVHSESRIARNDDWESWMSVAWLAVQESWRLALLAYLYLAVCRLPSDDVRIQRCVTQILQVVGTVRKQKAAKISVPFLIQYLIVGICAQSEKKRDIIRNRLSDAVETKLWMMRGSDFTPVLDHLWHGAGANGHPITWDDYIRSRETVLPVLT
ncbi:hypothetical protein RHS04_00145 [Rhizoctonia solani]|uniref:Uncharacterized protein n=1 Tax=Rhizoctonia solani TaxID=456999 RepID=A0A8H7HFT7_9AGAM|nr:hypothetical protein RHS04_00145 [Rhizoctonia solani]